MNAAIEAIAGPIKGQVFSLSREENSIGREPANAISILDGSVSRRHCLIRWDADQFVLVDLGSRNRTLVNGAPVEEHVLRTGDEIRVGNSLFRFFTEKDPGEDTSEQLGAERTPSTIVLRKEDAVYLKSGEAASVLPPTNRTVRDLNALLTISRVINSVRGLDALQRQILDSVVNVIPAERAAIILAESGAPDYSAISGWDKRAGPEQPVPVSRTIVGRVLEEGVAVLSNDLSEMEEFSDAESVVRRKIRSVLAVPIEVLDRRLGAIYMDASDPRVIFDEGHLQLLTAAGSVAGLALENARRMEWLETENERLQAEINVEHNMVGDSGRMKEVYQFISRVASTEATVLIRGESGTGKELVARAIHQNSARNGRPYVAINCAALTETLLESELFGYEKGAFTGAMGQKKGKLEVADHGTVFLDEIGELAPSLQAKLLRVLQEREFERVGGTKTIKLDVRILAATNRELEEEVRGGKFRQDLFFRLNVVSVRMPPLRERREDISVLATHFAMKYAERAKRAISGISPEARACLWHYDWPGNVRELENAMERAVVLGSSEFILPEDLPESVLEKAGPGAGSITAFHDRVRESKKQLIMNAFEQADGNYTEAAKLLGLHPNYLHRLIRNLNLKGVLTKQAASGANSSPK
jgi:transcriptional regulator with GAF, ATPase, and Fis domain